MSNTKLVNLKETSVSFFVLPVILIALGGGLGRPRRLGIPLQKERGKCNFSSPQSHFVLENAVDHIRDKSKGGGEEMDNLLVLCPNCHAKKTYGAIKIHEDYRYSENNLNKELLHDNHLKILISNQK